MESIPGREASSRLSGRVDEADMARVVKEKEAAERRAAVSAAEAARLREERDWLAVGLGGSTIVGSILVLGPWSPYSLGILVSGLAVALGCWYELGVGGVFLYGAGLAFWVWGPYSLTIGVAGVVLAAASWFQVAQREEMVRLAAGMAAAERQAAEAAAENALLREEREWLTGDECEEMKRLVAAAERRAAESAAEAAELRGDRDRLVIAAAQRLASERAESDRRRARSAAESLRLREERRTLGTGAVVDRIPEDGSDPPTTWSIGRLKETLAFAGIDTTGCTDKADLVALVTSHGLHCQGKALASCRSTGRKDAADPDAVVEDCPICQEALTPAQAAMRCRGGPTQKHHYYHAGCLAKWIQDARLKDESPTCPMCRGPLQVNTRRLGDFLSDHAEGAPAGSEDNEVLQSLYDTAQRARGPAPVATQHGTAAPSSPSSVRRRRLGPSRFDHEWEVPDWETALASQATAGAMLGLGALFAGLDALHQATRHLDSP
jgi:hypothetical protein